jgi:hypothetical protein
MVARAIYVGSDRGGARQCRARQAEDSSWSPRPASNRGGAWRWAATSDTALLSTRLSPSKPSLRTRFEHYNQARPHRGLDLRTPIAPSDPVVTWGPVRCDEVLGGLLREYSRAPMPAAA